MGFFTFQIILAVSIALVAFYVYRQGFAPVPAPNVELNKYWGPSARKNRVDSAAIQPFKVQYSTDVINELRQRLRDPLKGTSEPLEGVGFQYGFHRSKLDELIKYWRDDYLPRWNERQAFLNSLPHFQTEIQGLKIHFIHTKDQTVKTKNVIPLLLIHGWPGSVREFYELIPKLTARQKDDVSFVVVAPSLPGYGWSEGASIPDLGPTEMAIIFRNLMLKLGYQKFLVQGGDWGSLIGSTVATLFPENVIGYHSNACWVFTPAAQFKTWLGSYYPSLFVPEKYTELFYPQGQKFKYLLEESGYFHIQATKPDTIGIALANNPVGLAAYILEKFSTWTNPINRDLNDGGLDNDFSKDALFDNLMIYYLTNSITTSVRLYAEAFTIKQLGLQLDRVATNVPTGCARFKNDIGHSLDWVLHSKYTNLVHSTYHLNGGHFIALQLPDVLHKDFLQFVGKINVIAA